MKVTRTRSGDLEFRDVPGICARAIESIPGLLESDDPRVRDRMLPRTHDNDEEEAEWRRIGAPELEHLFAARSKLIAKDLGSLRRRRDGTFRLTIDTRHESAWLSGLNLARHSLFILNELEPDDMERDPDVVENEGKALALYQIHLFAWMQELLIRAGGALGLGDDEDSEEPDAEESDSG
jgi:hypothetical protein